MAAPFIRYVMCRIAAEHSGGSGGGGGGVDGCDDVVEYAFRDLSRM